MKALLFIIVFISFHLQIFAIQDQSRIDKRDLKNYIKVLSADSMEGRGTGSEGQIKAAKFISDRFMALELDTYTGDSYYEKFAVYTTYWNEIYIKTANVQLDNFDQMVLQGYDRLNTEVEREVVFGGRGTDQELDQIDVANRFVLVFIDKLRTYFVMSKKLAERNAFGVILANPENNQQYESIKKTFKDFNLAKRYRLENEDSTNVRLPNWEPTKLINSVILSNSQIKNVMGLSEKELKKLIKQNAISEAPISSIKAKFEKVKELKETANVVSFTKGRSNKTIVVSAHYDHLGKIDDTYFPGADDNASGTAALLELAEEFSSRKDLEHNILFLATSAEEAGLLGSSYHVNHPAFDTNNILCNINIDMISRTDEKHISNDYLYVIGTDQLIGLDKLVKKADASFEKCSFDYSLNNTTDPLGMHTRSDSYSFHKKGIPAIFFFAGLHEDYHQSTDTYHKIDFANLENRVKQIAEVISMLQVEEIED